MNNKGISLLSLVITIIVIIIIASIGMLNGNKHLDEANKAKFQVDLKSVVEALDVYNERAEIDEFRGNPDYDEEKLSWDGISERAQNTAKMDEKDKEDTIKYIMGENKIPDSLKGIVSIENGKFKVKKDEKPQYDWAIEMYGYMKD